MLDELVERFGTDAVVTARPVMRIGDSTHRTTASYGSTAALNWPLPA
jgi:hypothetical protein